jgi:hypothetical protein
VIAGRPSARPSVRLLLSTVICPLGTTTHEEWICDRLGIRIARQNQRSCNDVTGIKDLDMFSSWRDPNRFN